MRQMTLGFALVLVVSGMAVAQDPLGGGSRLGSSTPKPGMSREELVRSWDRDGDGTISKSEADLARARMRRQRTELQLGESIDPLTGLPRRPEGDEAGPEYPLPTTPPTGLPAEPGSTSDDGKRPTTPPKTLTELLAPTTPVPGLPRLPNFSGKPESPASNAPPVRSSRASWLPPSRSDTTGVGGPRAGAPPAVAGYGSAAGSDLNAGRPRSSQTGSNKLLPDSGRMPTTGGGLLPTARKPGQTGAILLPVQRDLRLAPATPAAPRPPTVPLPRVGSDPIGGYGP